MSQLTIPEFTKERSFQSVCDAAEVYSHNQCVTQCLMLCWLFVHSSKGTSKQLYLSCMCSLTDLFLDAISLIYVFLPQAIYTFNPRSNFVVT